MSYSPFDFVKEIQVGKHDLMTDPQSEKDYVAFIINKTLSYEMDCLLHANEMNRRHHLDRKLNAVSRSAYRTAVLSTQHSLHSHRID